MGEPTPGVAVATRSRPTVPLAGRGAYPAAQKRAPSSTVAMKYGLTPPPEPTTPVTPTTSAESAHLAGADLVFDVKVRKLLDHRLRVPHRRYIPEKLLKVIAHWVSQPVGNTIRGPSHKVTVECSEEGPSIPVVVPTSPSGNQINARVLLNLGTDMTQQDRHILTRVSLLVGASLDPNSPSVMSYGGLVAAGSDEKVTTQLKKLVKDQSGLDLSGVKAWRKLVEFQYSEGPNTVFYMPDLSQANVDLVALPQATEKEMEVLEQFKEEVPEDEGKKDAKKRKVDEDAKGEDVPQTKTVVKMRTVMKTKKTIVVRPMEVPMALLLDYQVHRGTPFDTIELCSAVDALDEFYKREMATDMLRVLRMRGEEARVKAEMDRQRQAEEEIRKKKREDDEGCVRRQRAQRDANLRRKWAEEDEGKTDEEKRESMLERQVLLRKMREADANEDKERLEKIDEEETQTLPQKKTKVIQEANPDIMDTFAYFDRESGFEHLRGSLPRLRIENLLLCLDEDLTLEDVRSLIDLPQLPKRQPQLPYKIIALDTRTVEVEETPTEPAPAAEANEMDVDENGTAEEGAKPAEQ